MYDNNVIEQRTYAEGRFTNIGYFTEEQSLMTPLQHRLVLLITYK